MAIELDLQLAVENEEGLPSQQDFQLWLDKTIPLFQPQAEVTIRIVDELESHTLNHEYRGKDKPTNVLSFPTQNTVRALIVPVLGDIVLAFETIEHEAELRSISLADHTAHLIIHGYLHLQGLDHQNHEEEKAMETCEINALQHLGIANPYVKD